MNARHGVALSAACSTLLATAPISTVFGTWMWAFYAALVIGTVSGTAIAARALRAQLWAQILAMLAALTVMVTWLSHAPHAVLGTVPTAGTLRAFGSLLASAADDIAKSGLPVPDTQGLLFLVAAGIGVVAVIVDVFAVGLRRPAMAGFPMLAIYAIPVFVHLDSVSPIPFMIGAIGFLWLLVVDNVDRVRRFGRRFTGDGRGLDLWEPSPLAAAGRRLAVAGVVLAVAVPVMVPGMTGGLLSRINGFGDGPGTGTGTGRGASVNLFAELSGKLNNSQQFEMLKVNTTDPNPFYLRFAVADQLSSKGFASTGPGAGQAVTEGGIPDPAMVNVAGVTQKAYHAKVTVTNFSMSYLPVYQRLSRTTKGLDGSWLYDSVGNQVYSNRSVTTKNKSYEFDYLATTFSPAALRSASVIDGQNTIRQYAQVPADQPALVKTTVTKIVQGQTTEYDRVLAILRYFSAANGFTYSVSTSKGTSGSDLVDFLNNKQGFCQQYAVAMAWLARAAGIPARVAFGFTQGMRTGDAITLTNLDLHAWTEIYFPGYGWVPFDPTPNRSGSVRTAWAPDANQPITLPSQTTGGSTTGGGTDPGNDPQKAQHAPSDRDPGTGTATTNAGSVATWPWWLLGSVLLLALVAAMPAMRRLRLRRRRGAGTGRDRPAAGNIPDVALSPGRMTVVVDPTVAVHDAHEAWDELVDTLVDYAVPVNDTQTPRVLVHEVAESLELSGPSVDALRLLGHVEERARYARTPLVTGDLGTSLRSVRGAVAATRSRSVRLRAALFPPSVLHRWRYQLTTRGAALTARISHLQETAIERLTPRRLLPRRGTR